MPVRPDVGRIVLVGPGPGAEDGLLVGVHEAAQLAETLLEDGRDAPPRVGAHVQQHVPVAGQRPRQLLHHLGRIEHLGQLKTWGVGGGEGRGGVI